MNKFKRFFIKNKEDYREIYQKRYCLMPLYYCIATFVAVFVGGLIEIMLHNQFFKGWYVGLWSFITGTKSVFTDVLAYVMWIVVALVVSLLVKMFLEIAKI